MMVAVIHEGSKKDPIAGANNGGGNLRRTLVILVTICYALLYNSATTHAMDASTYGEIQQLMQTPLRILTEKATALIKDKYENLDFALFNGADDGSLPFNALPEFVTVSRTVYVAYRIAMLKPELLASHTCYSPCDDKQSKNLLHCFFRDGNRKKFSEQASTCSPCSSEAILIFLWNELGADHGEINAYLRLMFDPALQEPPPTSLN